MIFKAIDQPDHVISVIEITVYKVIKKSIIKMDFLYQTDGKKKCKESLSGTGNPFSILVFQ